MFSTGSEGLWVVMEQPHGTDELHIPQDLSTSALPPALDLTRRGVDQCALVRRNSAWYHNADSNHTGVPDTTPVTAQHSGQIQPDNAFSQTTVTLSYVSRSHVFSTHDSLSGNSVYGVPTFSKYSLQPPCEFEETGVALNQDYLDNVDGANDLSEQTEVLQSLSQTQLDLEANTKQSYEFNRKGIPSEEQGESGDYNVNSHDFLQNGKNLWLSESLDICDASLPECPVALKTSETPHTLSKSLCSKSDYSRDQHDSLQSSSTVLSENSQSLQSSESLLESSKLSVEFSQDCLEFLPESSELVPVSSEPICETLGSSKVLPNNMESHENNQPNSPKTLEVSTAAESENFLGQSQEEQDTEDVLERNSPEVVFVSSTPEKTLDNQYRDIISPVEDPASLSATSLDNIDVFMLPEASSLPSGDNSLLETTDNLSSTHETTQLASEDCTPEMHSVCKRKSVVKPLIDLTADDCMSNVLEENLNNKVLNGNTKSQRKMINVRKQPVRSSRGMRIESVVMNINSSRYNVSGSIQTSKKSLQFDNTKLRKSSRLLSCNKKCVSEETSKVLPKKKTSASPENCRHSTSGSELRSTASSTQATSVRLKRKPPKHQRPQSVNSQESQVDTRADISIESTSSTARSPKSPKHCPSKTENTEPTKKPCLRTKAKGKSKKKQKIFRGGNASSMFAPKEPEIQLKYVNYKEEKRDSKMDCFKPFIRVQRKEQVPSLVTVINYPDEVKTTRKQNQSRASMEYVSAVVPTTSCLQLGRASMQGDQQGALVCCLCGQSANAMDLGDLHGPYYSEGYKPSPKKSKEGSEAKEVDSSNSDMSDSESCNGRRKWASIRSKQQWRGADGKSPAAKRARTDTEDWYSPPTVPLGPCEYWLHEDCGVWSVGVFLVRGKVYGLEEAVRAAQTTKCSSCGDRGASMGCLFKGCANKYHYRCALHSDCVLMEENFSIRCRKHKNKTMKASQRQEQR